MNLFYSLFYDKWVNGSFYPMPVTHYLFWSEALSSFPTIDSIQGISSVSRRTKKVVLIILHHTGSLEFDKALKWFSNPNTYSSTNYLIDLDGHILCLVPEDRGALHMPNSTYNYSRLVNEMSVGITLVGDGTTHFSEAQYEGLAMLCVVLAKKYGLKLEDIKRHADIQHTGEQHSDPTPFDRQKFENLFFEFSNI